MTSLFDLHDEPAMPVDLVTRGRRSVSLLEFVAFPAPVQEVLPDLIQPHAVDERAAQVTAMLDAARESTAQEVRAACKLEFDQLLAAERARAQSLILEFAGGRQRYFASAEEQVVKLALAIARRVLQREVESCSLPLQGTVRAALARVSDGSRSTLRVNAFEAAAWLEHVGKDVEVVGEERIGAGKCTLETSVGRVEIGVQTQMEEIERGFDELLARQGARKSV